MDPLERIRGGCIVGHTIEGRAAAGRIPSRRPSLATLSIDPAGTEMPEHCTCGSPVSPDDSNCPLCGKPLSPEQAAAEAEQARAAEQKKQEREPWERRQTLKGVVFYTTAIPACAAVIVQDLVGAATVPAVLLSFCVSVWAGFVPVLLFHLKFPHALYPNLAYQMGLFAGIIMMLIAIALGMFGSLTKWPMGYIVEAAPHIMTHPVVTRLTSGMTPWWSTVVVLHIVSASFGLIHSAAALMGSVIAMWVFPHRPDD